MSANGNNTNNNASGGGGATGQGPKPASERSLSEIIAQNRKDKNRANAKRSWDEITRVAFFLPDDPARTNWMAVNHQKTVGSAEGSAAWMKSGSVERSAAWMERAAQIGERHAKNNDGRTDFGTIYYHLMYPSEKNQRQTLKLDGKWIERHTQTDSPIEGRRRKVELDDDGLPIVSDDEGDDASTTASTAGFGSHGNQSARQSNFHSRGGRLGGQSSKGGRHRHRAGRGHRGAGPKPDQQPKEAIKAKLDKDLDDYFQNKSD
ncbi:Nonribosomal peptide synthase atnA [Apiospora arundinis]